MPKFQVCPYCGSGYGYRKLLTLKSKEQECYHCKKKFVVRKRYRAIPVAIACIIMIIVNVALLLSKEEIDRNLFRTMVIIDAAVIFAAFVAAPCFTRIVRPNKKRR